MKGCCRSGLNKIELVGAIGDLAGGCGVCKGHRVESIRDEELGACKEDRYQPGLAGGGKGRGVDRFRLSRVELIDWAGRPQKGRGACKARVWSL